MNYPIIHDFINKISDTNIESKAIIYSLYKFGISHGYYAMVIDRLNCNFLFGQNSVSKITCL